MKLKNILLSSLLLTGSLFASQPQTIQEVSLEQANKAIQACVDLAKKNKWAMSIAVVDRGSNVKASSRMDGALSPSMTGATLKANTSLSWFAPTEKVAEYVKANPNFKQFPGLLPLGGGVPLFFDGKLIGAVGVAGSMLQNDIACAQAAAKAIAK